MNKAFEKILERFGELHERYVNQYGMVGGNPMAFSVKECMKIVHEVAKEYNGGWIACSERLPEVELEKAKKERGSEAVFPVLATINKKHTVTGEKYITVGRAFYGCYYNDKNFYNSCCDKLDVIAWQPLPEPFKERD